MGNLGTLNSLTVTLVAAGLLGFTAGNVTILSVSAVLLLSLLARLGHVLVVTRGMPVVADSVGLRVLVGEEGHAEFHLRNETPFPLRIFLSSLDPWLSLSANEMNIGARGVEAIGVTATPPLAGPGRPVIHATLLDPWGLLWKGVETFPLNLRVIPRARYAAWLARRYLEQTGRQQAAATVGQLNRIRGVEFERLRQYQPGDRLKDIDWRHITKSRVPVVKEYLDPQGSGTYCSILWRAMRKRPTGWAITW